MFPNTMFILKRGGECRIKFVIKHLNMGHLWKGGGQGELHLPSSPLVHRRPTKYLYTSIEYHSGCPLVGIGTLPPPLSPASVPLPRNQRGRADSPAGEGLGESQFRRLEEKLSTLPTLCYYLCTSHHGLNISFPCSNMLVEKHYQNTSLYFFPSV